MEITDDRRKQMADRWDALVAQGIPEEQASESVRQEFDGAPKRALTPEQIARLDKSQREKNAAEKVSKIGGFVDALLEAPQTVAAGVPGAKLLMSKGHSMLYGKPMADVQADINERTSDVPYASAIGRGAGSVAALGAGPMAGLSAAKGGAALMGLDGFLSNDPDAELRDRVSGGLRGVGAGLLAGKAAEFVSTAGRALLAPSLGRTANAIKDTITASDDVLYGAAKVEGDAVKSTPEIVAALSHPKIRPFAEEVRNAEQFAGANDAEILRETYKLMSEKARNAGRTIANSTDFKAGTTLGKDEIKLLQRTLRDAGGTAMPSFPKAVVEHAKLSKFGEAFSLGADAARREMGNSSIMGAKQAKLSPEGTRRALGKMNARQARAMTMGVLGRTSEMMTPNSSMINLFGIPRALRAIYRAGPLLRATDQASGANRAIGAERGLLAFLNAR